MTLTYQDINRTKKVLEVVENILNGVYYIKDFIHYIMLIAFIQVQVCELLATGFSVLL